MVKRALIKLKKIYPIDYSVVLAYLPESNRFPILQPTDNTILPERIETVPKKFAITYRNKWMLNHSEYVVTYVKHVTGGAVQFKRLAERQKKTVINLAD